MFCIGCIISTVYECRVFGITQKEIAYAFIKGIDKDCGVLSDDVVSKIVSGSRNPSGYLMESLSKMTQDSYEDLEEYFQKNIVSRIKENERKKVRRALTLMIQEAHEIEEDTIVEIISGIKKADLWDTDYDLSTFLAGIYLYALKNTSNICDGQAKVVAKAYLDRVKNGEKPVHKLYEDTIEDKGSERDKDGSMCTSNSCEMMEEQTEREAREFCVKHEKEMDYLMLCQMAWSTYPLRNHHREMYNDFCLCSKRVKKRILMINEAPEFTPPGRAWLEGCFTLFEKDYEEYNLGAKEHEYVFRQYISRLLKYTDEPLGDPLTFRFLPVVEDNNIGADAFRGKDLIGFIMEYINYREQDDHKYAMEPPLDLLWDNIGFGDCDEWILTFFIALFIIGSCHAVAYDYSNGKRNIAFSGPSIYMLDTAEDLFYLTLLTLYEMYGAELTLSGE